MKKTTKLLAVVLAAMMLLIPLSTTVFAMDMANIIGIDLDAILGALGGLTGNNGNTGTDETNGGGIDLSDFLSDPSSILSAFSGLLGNVSTEDLIGAITTVLGGGGGAMNMDQLMESVLVLLGTFESTTAPVETTTEETTTEETTTEETTTEETTTEVPTTTPPTTQAPPVYTPPTYTPTTQAPETTTYTYIPPEIVTMEPLTGETYAPVIYDDNVGSSDDVTVKMVIGIVILVISGAAVVAVAIVLKKSRV